MATDKIKRRFILGLALFIVMVVTGCGKLTQENYDRINTGMTYNEVLKWIGEPTSCDALFSIKQCFWKEGRKRIDIKFINDQVVIFSARNL